MMLFAGKELFRQRKQFLIGLVMVCLVLNVVVSVPVARASVWGEDIAATLLGETLDIIKRQIEGAILGALKAAAITIMNSQVGQMIGGTSAGNALFITDWNDYLYRAPSARTKLVMNDFFTVATRGKYASANYTGIGDTTATVAGNYPAYLVNRAQATMPDQTDDLGVGMGSSYNLDEYTPNPATMFRKGDFRGFSAFISNPANNPFGYTIQAQSYYSRTLSMETESARTKAQSSGFLGKEVNGRTIAPAKTIGDMVSNVQNIGNTLIAAADNPAALLTGVVTAVVNKAVSNLVQNGIGKIQASIQREMKKVDKQVNVALNKFNKQLGPGAQFLKQANQQTNTYIKPFTKAPPDAGVYCGGGC